MSLGASLTWNDFWTNFLKNGFHGLKGTIKLYILAENEKKPWSRFQENSKNLMFDLFFLILKKLKFF